MRQDRPRVGKLLHRCWEWAQESVQRHCRKSFFRMSHQPYLPAPCLTTTGYLPCHVQRQFHPNIVSRMRDMEIVSMPWSRVQLPGKRWSTIHKLWKLYEAFMKEWKGLWDQEVFGFSQTREYDDVVNEAKRKGQKVHIWLVYMD